ncbi:MAG TPA: tetratricopeptide repeat protein, partial [Thermodesulfobacteriota bacterium]|nr:tetratricopeptide repeat protein [Thermodesulfobacteriota bacterium]
AFLSLDLQSRLKKAREADFRLLHREARERTVVLAFDNLQWVESETEQALEALVRDIPRSTLIIVSCRPEYAPDWMRHPEVRHIPLKSLPRGSAAELLEDLLGKDPSVALLKDFILERAGGNPLFIEECVHNLVQREILAGDQGNRWLKGSAETLEVPPSLRSLIEARIDRLPDEPRHVLQCAAVIGEQVPVRVLQEVSGLPLETVVAALGQLQEVGLIDHILKFPESSYAFHHAISHDVAYQNLVHDRRRSLHAKVLEALERFHPGDRANHFEQLAHHAIQGELWAKGVEYLRDSANKALSSGRTREATEFLKDALRAATHLSPGPERTHEAIDLREDLSRAMKIGGESSAAVAILREAVDMAEAAGDERRLARLLSFLSNALWDVAESRAAIQAGHRAAAIAERLGEVELEAVANFSRGVALRALGEYPQAAEYLRRNLSLLEGDLAYKTLGLTGLASVLTRGHLAWSLSELGEFGEARRRSEEALRLAEAADHPYSVAHAHLARGGTLIRQGQVLEAMTALDRGLKLCRDAPFLDPPMAADLALAYAFSGRLTAALQLAEEAVLRAEEGGRLGRLSLIVSHLGEIYHLAGKPEPALARARRAL